MAWLARRCRAAARGADAAACRHCAGRWFLDALGRPLQSILESIQGPVARIVAVIIIIATGLALAFGDTSGGFRKLIQIVFGLSIAFAASSFFLSFFSFSGGAVV
jgi:type IV secretory pathway VirB2 component (pilin)